MVVGNKDVIAATMATLADFPDRTLLGEDVIRCGTPEDGLLSSHRLLSTTTHLNAGLCALGPGPLLRFGEPKKQTLGHTAAKDRLEPKGDLGNLCSINRERRIPVIRRSGKHITRVGGS